MPRIEEFVQRVDVEIEKLKLFLDNELKPTTARRAAELLRAASKRLGEMADELDTSTPNEPSRHA